MILRLIPQQPSLLWGSKSSVSPLKASLPLPLQVLRLLLPFKPPLTLLPLHFRVCFELFFILFLISDYFIGGNVKEGFLMKMDKSKKLIKVWTSLDKNFVNCYKTPQVCSFNILFILF